MKRLSLLILYLVTCLVMSAGIVTTEQAEQIALQFLNKHHPTGTKRSVKMAKRQQIQLNSATDATAYYVYNVGSENGYVIVSGSDLAPQVLGYSSHGSFRQEAIPDNMKAWLQGYSDQIAYLERTEGRNEAPRQIIHRNAISPLLTSTWNQGAPYNLMCPNDPTTGTRTVTGCVATALAQVINYHKFPTQTIAPIPAYTTTTKNISMSEIDITSIDWDNILDNYDGSETSEQGNAIAQLMLLCGQAVEMDYNISANGGSGAYTSADAKALQKYFGYDKTVRYLKRNTFGTVAWESLIYDELASGRPVLYGGQSTGGGHAFVIDGYNGDGLFHINWGWGGVCDSYFALSILNPYNNSSIGASSSDDGFSIDQDAIVGVQHGTGEIIPERFTIYGLSNTGSSTITRNSVDENFTGMSFQLKGYNMTGDTHNVKLTLSLVNADNNRVESSISGVTESSKDDKYGWGALSITDCTFGSGLSDGDYYIVPVSMTENSEDWEPCWGTDVYRIKANISGNTLSLTSPSVNLSSTIQATGNTKVMETLPLTAQITNNGSYFNDYVYIAVDGYIKGGRMLEAQEGETVDFDIDFVPTTAGRKTLLLAYKGSNGYVIIGSGVVTVMGDLDCVINITNATEGIVRKDKVTATVNITNNASDYDNDIILRLFKYDASSDSYNYADMQFQHLTLASGETSALDFEFTGLENAQQYVLSLMYYKAGNMIQDADAAFVTQILQNGDLFTMRTEENINMTFKVISTVDKTCQVGAGTEAPTIIIGDDATGSSNQLPYDNYYKYSTTQMLYTPTEVGKAGKITKIAFKVVSSTSCSTSSVKIYMGHKSSLFSSATDYVASSNLTLVYSGSPTLGNLAAWEIVTLNQSFTYNGIDNLVIVVTKSCSEYKSGLKYSCFTGTGYTLYRQSDSDTSCGNITSTISYNTSNNRPSVKFFMESTPVAISTTTKGIVTIPAIVDEYKVVEIGEKAFYNCTNISGVRIPYSVANIQDNAFYGCTSLVGVSSKIRFPFAIPTNAFSSVSTNATLYVPYGSTPRYDSANGWNQFLNIVEMEPEDSDVFTAKTEEGVDMTFKVISASGKTCVVATGNESPLLHVPTIPSNTPDFITIPEETNGFTVKGVEEYAFYGCNALAAVSIPNGVLSIGSYAFDGCSSLASVYVETETPVIIDETVFPNRANATLHVPVGFKSIYESAVFWKDFKEIIEMPDKVNNAIDLVDALGCRGGLVIQPVLLKNIQAIVGFQFDLALSDGLSVAQDADGKYLATLTDRTADHLLSVNKVSEGLYRFISISMNNKEFKGTEGTVLNVKLRIDESVALGSYNVKVQNTELVTSEKSHINSIKNISSLTVKDAEPGDVNGDMTVSVTDVVSLIAYIMDDKPATFLEYAAYMNDDKKISVTDVVIVIDKILNEGATSNSRVEDLLGVEPQ